MTNDNAPLTLPSQNSCIPTPKRRSVALSGITLAESFAAPKSLDVEKDNFPPESSSTRSGCAFPDSLSLKSGVSQSVYSQDSAPRRKPPTPIVAHKSTIREYFSADVDTNQCNLALSILTFLTGWLDAITLSSIFVWVGFQTGNFTQLAVAVARLWEGPPSTRDITFQVADQQALTAVLSFNIGIVFGRVGDSIGAKKRIWLFATTLVQCTMTTTACIALWKSGEQSIPDSCLMSANLGMQGVMAKRLNTQFGTSLVLTTVMVETMGDPKIWHRSNPGRTQRLLALFSLFLGGFVSRALLPYAGAAGCLGIATGLKFFVTVFWLVVPSASRADSA
ncbi:hypothetical protein DL96DRAFT_1737862 [Flagelloscypha sp. PMI_526]|nr:hypothetical protein DL96DRAFT_1737862 [Flagelloscypha sp. PMI_526]